MALSAQAQAELAELSLSLAHNPKTRKAYTKLVQELDPSKRFPDVEHDDLRDSIRNEFAARDQQTQAERMRQRMEDQRQSLITSGRFKAEEVEKMEKDVMEKHGISDYDVAAKVYMADMKPASPTHEIKTRTWQLPTMDRASIDNIGQSTLTNAYNVIDELKANRKRY